MSSDGNVVVFLGFQPEEMYVWTASGRVTNIGDLGGGGTTLAYLAEPSTCLSADGSTVVGQSYDASGGVHAFRWTAATGMTDLGTIGGSYSGAHAVSTDGATVVGDSSRANGEWSAFRWTASGGMQDIGAPFSQSKATQVNADGSAVVVEARGFSQGSLVKSA